VRAIFEGKVNTTLTLTLSHPMGEGLLQTRLAELGTREVIFHTGSSGRLNVARAAPCRTAENLVPGS
jgi:hypothetical protein